MLHAASLLPRCPNAQDKKRNNKLRDVDVGGALLALELLPDPAASPLAHWAGDVLRDVAADEALSAADWGAVRLRTRCVPHFFLFLYLFTLVCAWLRVPLWERDPPGTPHVLRSTCLCRCIPAALCPQV